MSTISAGNTTTTAFKVTADTSGNVVLQSNGTNVATVNTAGVTINTGYLKFSDGTSMTTAAVGGGGPGAFQAIQSANFTATANNIYAVNTAAATVYVNLPATPSVGQYVTFIDFARTFATNNLIINPNGSLVEGISNTSTIGVNGAAVSAVYSGSVQGWLQYSGVTTPQIGGYAANYLVAAGGGGGGNYNSGAGGGAGGLLTGISTLVPGQTYTVVVGAGGSAAVSGGGGQTSGANSSIVGSSTSVLAIGGGYGGGVATGVFGANGGSGGGSSAWSGGTATPGSGTVGQGNNGGSGVYATGYPCGGGGGASQVGATGSVTGSVTGGQGGNGTSSTISGTATYYCGGGGGGTQVTGTGGSGGLGGGGTGGDATTKDGTAGTTNRGGGGGGGGYASGTGVSGAGGSGIVILSYQGSQRGSGGTVTSAAGYTIHTFTSSGTYTA